MTAERQQTPTATHEHPRQEPAATAPRAVGQPVATVAAAAQAATARPAVAAPQAPQAPQNEQSGPARILPEDAAAPVATGTAARSAEPPREPPARREPLELPVLRIVCWQLALVLAFLAIGKPWPVGTGLLLTAAGLLGSTATRVRGRWLSDELTLRARLLLRRHNGSLPEAESGRALLRTLAPGAEVRTVELAGAQAGVVSRAEELLVVLRPVDTDPGEFTRLALSGALLAESGEPGAVPTIRLRLVLHRGPQATDRTRAWLAVGALRDPNFADDADLLVVLNNTARRLYRKLRKAGTGVAALTEQELLGTLVALTHTGPGRGAIREDRRYWRAGPVTQVGFRLSGLGTRPVRARMHTLHHMLGAVPGAACTIAITVPGHAAALRVAATTDAAVDAAAGRLSWLPPPGVRLERMDNQHGPAVAASLPIGGDL